MTSTELRAKANACRQEAHDSFQRCDTDGFLSQWASGVNAAKYEMEADLMDAGGVASFWGLFNRHGQRVTARLVSGEFGLVWAVHTRSGRTVWVPHTVTFDEEPNAFGGTTFVRPRFGPRTKGARLGLTVAWEDAPARVDMTGSGRGLGSLHTVRPVEVRTDGGWPPDAVPFDEEA